MTREEYKAIVFADLKPLFDAGITLPYDEKRYEYNIQEDGLLIRADGRIYDYNHFVQDGYTVKQFVKEQLAPRVIEDKDFKHGCCYSGYKVEFESFEDGKEINVLNGELRLNNAFVVEKFIPQTEPLKDGNYILVNAGKNQWLNDEDRIFFAVENGKIKLSK